MFLIWDSIIIIRYRLFLVLTIIKISVQNTKKSKKSLEKFCWFGKKQYLCTRFRPKTWVDGKKKEFFERFT
jgi:hypothetical protein